MPNNPLLVKNNTRNLFKKDGWKNLLTGLGGKQDKTKYNSFDGYTVLTDEELGQLYVGDGIPKRIVNLLADDMTRNWVTATDDADNKIHDELDRLDAQNTCNEALKMSRLYGGAIIVIGTKDSAELSQPLPINIRGIDYLKVFESPRVKIEDAMLIKDPKSPRFGEIEKYRITPINGIPFEIHHSRCIVLKGEKAPGTDTQLDTNRRYWGLSALQAPWNRVVNFGATEQSLQGLAQEATVSVYKLSNLLELLSDVDGKDKVYDRMEIINASKSILNAVILGEDESFDRNSLSFSGIPEMIDRWMISICASTGYPMTRLFMRSPAGLNSNGDGDLTNYYDMVAAAQRTILRKPLNQLVKLIASYTTKQQHSIEFKPVWEPSEAERIEMRKKQAEIDNIYYQMGVIGAEEIRTARFVNGYSHETDVEDYGAISE